MPEFRQNPLSGDWVLLALERGRREGTLDGIGPRFVAAGGGSCPFCPTADDSDRVELDRLTLPGDSAPWQVRTVENRYPAVMLDARASASSAVPGVGHHELILLSPLHHRTLFDMTPPEAALAVEMFQRRWVTLRAREGVGAVSLFINYGAGAGASQPHPHGQVIATAQVPERLRRMALRARGTDHPETLHATLLAGETRGVEGSRRVFSLGGWRAVMPYAPEWPWETWILPEHPEASFAALGGAERAALAEAVQRALRLLERVLGGVFPFNLILELPPVGVPDHAEAFPWHVRIVPRLHVPGGYDLYSGILINPVGPEQAAARLRESVQNVDKWR